MVNVLGDPEVSPHTQPGICHLAALINSRCEAGSEREREREPNKKRAMKFSNIWSENMFASQVFSQRRDPGGGGRGEGVGGIKPNRQDGGGVEGEKAGAAGHFPLSLPHLHLPVPNMWA